MNKILALPSLILIITITGCDRIAAEFQLGDKKTEIADLKATNVKLINENRDLTAQVARLNTGTPDGAVVEELRKALTKKESELNLLETRLNKREQAIISNETNLDKNKREFLSNNEEGLKSIGEATQLKAEYEFMRGKYNDSENRANNWLIYISILIAAFVITLFFTIHKSMRYSARNKQIDTALRIIESSGIDNKDKKLVMSTFERLENDPDTAS